jgi:hypothetical protein
MNKICSIASIIAVAGLSAAVHAQTSVRLRLDRVEDFFSLTLNPTTGDNAFFVGTSLSCIETDGTPNNWFVGGLQGGTQFQPWDAQVVKIEFNLALAQGEPGYRSFRAIPDSQTTAPSEGSAEGITGLDYAPGLGLVVTTDSRLFEGGKVKVFDVNSQLNPILTTKSIPTGAREGSAGPSWDKGPGGTGVTYQRRVLDEFGQPVLDGSGNPTFETATVPAMVSTIRFGDRGPRGSFPSEFFSDVSEPPSFLDIDTAGLRLGYFAGNGGAQTGLIPGSPLLVDDTTGVNHRDIKIHPSTGVIAIRAQADVILASRQADGTVLPQNRARFGPTAESGTVPLTNVAAFTLGNRVQMLPGAPGGDLLVYNQRVSVAAGQPGANVIKFNRLPAVVDNTDPASYGPVTATYENADGTPFTLPNGTGLYDFAWIPATNQLIILDCGTAAGGSRAYVFTVNPAPAATCTQDYNGIDGINGDDLADYIADFFDSTGIQPGFGAPIAIPGGFAGNATAAFTGFGRPCPTAIDVPQPNPWNAPIDAYRTGGFKVSLGINNDACSNPNGDDLADYISVFFNGCP